MNKIYKYIVEENQTLTELTLQENSLFKNYIGREDELLLVSLDGKSNLDRIWDNYTLELKSAFQNVHDAGTLSSIRVGTELVIPEGETPVEIVAIGGKNLFLEQESFKGFWSEEYLKLLNDPNYIPLQEVGEKLGKSTTQIKNYEISVWIYIRSLDSILNLSSFVSYLKTESSTINSSFNINLNSIESPEDLLKFGKDSVFFHSIGEEITKLSYFHKHIQQNDIVFIKFEKLNLAADERIEELEVPRNKLAGQIYDFIGLVDICKESYISSETDITVTVSGRDLMKLFIEDGSYFYPQLFIKDSDKLFFNAVDDSRWFKRNFITGNFDHLFFYTLQSIKDNLGFIINQLSNLGVVNSDLFSSYLDRRTEVINITGANNDYLEWNEVNGIWQIIDLLVDSNLSNRRIANSQISRPDGTLIDQVNKVCEAPFVEFFGDTYSDKYVFIARQKPFTKAAVQDYISSNNIIDIESKNILSTDLTWEQEYYTWYQIYPKNMFLGEDANISLGYIPIVFFPEMADIFGNHRLSISDNYISYQAITGDTGAQNRDLFKEFAINDFSYVIEINQMLPFTRRGQIVINGDRRIKKNTYIRLVPTGEIYYVDNIVNTYTASNREMDRETILNVSRGMVEKWVRGDVISDTDTNRYTYWDVVDIELIRTTLIQKLTQLGGDTNEDVVNLKNVTKSNFGVNTDVFNFFLNRKQFD